jgi:hypothetical protein
MSKVRKNKRKTIKKHRHVKAKRNNKTKRIKFSTKGRGRTSATAYTTDPKCSICLKSVLHDKSLIPARCIQTRGQSAHRICKECWFDEKCGFALEHVDHKCPGCLKGMPFTKVPSPKYKEEDVVVLTSFPLFPLLKKVEQNKMI